MLIATGVSNLFVNRGFLFDLKSLFQRKRKREAGRGKEWEREKKREKFSGSHIVISGSSE